MPSSDSDFSSQLYKIINRQRASHRSAGLPDAAIRIDRLKRAESLLIKGRDAIVDALSQDFGYRSPYVTLITDIYTSITVLRWAAAHVEEWMRPEHRDALVPEAEARIEFMPKGVVGVMGPWNYPFNLVFSPLAGVLAAGNRAVLKPSELAPAGGALMVRLVAEAFDPDEVTVVLGGAEAGGEFAAAPFDHLVFTGSTTVGRHVMRAAAENLTPLTLELGGKSPVIVTEQFDLAEAAARVMTVKTTNAGQICLAPDYAFVPEGKQRQFADACVTAVKTMFPDGLGSPDYTSIINGRHFARLSAMVEDAKGKGAEVIEVFPSKRDKNERRFSPTLLIPKTFDIEAMREEIFGPVLPILGYGSIEEVINQIQDGPHPLALYYFGEDDEAAHRVLAGTASGGVTINDVMVHAFAEDLPFGGIGPSGMGMYHGRTGFLAFSHARSVYRQSPNEEAAMLFRPPYGKPIKQLIEQSLIDQ